MSSKQSQNFKSDWLLAAIKVGLYSALFMPLIIGESFIFPFIFPKQAFFQIVVEILLGLYIFLALKRPEFRPRSSWLFRAVLAYFAIMILSSVFGLNTYHSFWSNYERMAGVISLLHYLGFLFIAANIFKTKDDWHRFFDVSIFASLLEVAYGLGQLAGLSSFLHEGGTRLDGTIGNASFLAGYMLINAMFAFWLMLEKRSGGWRIFYGITIFLNLLILYKTETRGALLALIVGAAGLALFFIFAPKKALADMPFRSPAAVKKYALGALIFFAIILGGLWLARDTNFVASRPTLARITHISAQETGGARLMAWRMSLLGFREHPVFGWGPENYYILFNKYYNPYLYPLESWFDRSHNAFLDVLVNTGLLGFAVYLAIFSLAFWYLWRARLREKINYHTAAIFSMIFIAYAVQNFFVFDTQVTLLMIYLILSFVAFLSFGEGKKDDVGKPVVTNYFFGFVVAAALFLTMYFVNLKPGLASARGIDALKSLQQGQVAQSMDKFKAAYGIGTFGLGEVAGRVNDAALQILGGAQISDDAKKLVVEAAIDGMRRSLKLEPQNARYMMMLGNTYLAASQLDPAYLREAEALFGEALKLSPTREELYFNIGQVRMFQGRNDEALALFKKALDLNDTVPLSHWNYGLIAIALGQKELGEKEIALAKELGYKYDARSMQYLLKAYGQIKDWPAMAAIYQDWLVGSPRDPAAYAGLAAVYAQAGDKQKAKEAALKAVEVDPSYKAQADEFIKGLGI